MLDSVLPGSDTSALWGGSSALAGCSGMGVRVCGGTNATAQHGRAPVRKPPSRTEDPANIAHPWMRCRGCIRGAALPGAHGIWSARADTRPVDRGPDALIKRDDRGAPWCLTLLHDYGRMSLLSRGSQVRILPGAIWIIGKAPSAEEQPTNQRLSVKPVRAALGRQPERACENLSQESARAARRPSAMLATRPRAPAPFARSASPLVLRCRVRHPPRLPA